MTTANSVAWKLMLLLALASAIALITPVAYAQEGAGATSVFVEGFESGWGSWSADNGVWQIGTPTIGPLGCHTGAQCATPGLNANYTGGTNSRLVSPSIDLPVVVGREEIHVRFWQWFSYAWRHAGGVQVSVRETSGTWSGWANVGAAVSGNSWVWTPDDIDLTAYAGRTIKLAFLHYTSTVGGTAPGWYVDDIEVLKKVPEFTGVFSGGWGDWSADNGGWQIGAPTVGPGGCYLSTQCATPGLNSNYTGGTDSRLVSASIDLPDVVGDEELHLRFWQWFAYAWRHSGQVQVSVRDTSGSWSGWTSVGSAVWGNSWVWSPDDIDLTAYAGRTIKLAFLHYTSSVGGTAPGWYIDAIEFVKKVPAFTGTFSAGWGDWSTDNGTWQIGTPTVGPGGCYTSSRCATTGLNGNYTGGTDTRLVSPTVDLTDVVGSGEIHLRFWQWFSYAWRHSGGVQVSVLDAASGAWSGWSNVGSPVTNNSAVWTVNDIDLTAYAGKKIRLAFLHYTSSVGGTALGWYIDAIQIMLPAYNLSVIKTGTGTGTVTSTPAGINCGSTCSASFATGTNVQLAAAPAAGSVFAGWQGACIGTPTPCTVSIDGAKTVTAVFTATVPVYSLTVTKSGTGGGTVTSSPPGIDCGAACSASYSGGTSVTLTAVPLTGSVFAGWSGACSGLNTTCTISMTANKAATALFNLVTTAPDLVVSAFTVPVSGAECSQVSVTATTRNSGTGAARPSTTKYYFSADSSFSAEDKLVGSRAVSSLSPGGTDTGTATVTLPCSVPAAGTFYILAIADAENMVSEARETNNLLARSFKIGADLVVSAIAAATSARVCSSVAVTDTTKNAGLGAAVGTVTRCYLSIDSALHPWDPALEAGRTVMTLAPGASDTGTRSVQIPCDISPRTYYIICAADADGQATETSNSNNIKTKSIKIVQ